MKLRSACSCVLCLQEECYLEYSTTLGGFAPRGEDEWVLLVGRMMALARGEPSSESCEGGLGVLPAWLA